MPFAIKDVVGKELDRLKEAGIVWGAVCVKIECYFIGSISSDLPKIMQSLRDLLNGMLQFTKWDYAIY